MCTEKLLDIVKGKMINAVLSQKQGYSNKTLEHMFWF